MLLLIRPILFAFLQSDGVKKLIVDLLKAAAKTTDNKVDDLIVVQVEKAFFDQGA